LITEIVIFPLSPEINREQLLTKYRTTAQNWRRNPDLLHKQYFYDAARNIGGGVYLWKDMAAAKHWHGDVYRKMIEETYGGPPTFQYFDGCIIVDNIAQLVYEAPPGTI
jgi:hypothetical protein